MNNTQNTSASDTVNAAPSLDVDAVKARVTTTINTLFDLGSGWASIGIGYVRVAVENGARALERTAKHLEAFQGRFKKTEAEAEAKPAA